MEGKPVGFTATSVISVSADPPLLAFSVDSASSAWRALADAETLVVNFLTAAQVEVSARFATSGIDRFATTEWSRAADRRAGARRQRRLGAGRDPPADARWAAASSSRSSRSSLT